MDDFIRHFLGATEKFESNKIENVKIGYIISNRTELPLLTPVAFWPHSRHTKFVSYFPPRVDFMIDYRNVVEDENILDIGRKDILTTHEHKILKRFEPKRIGDICDYVKHNNTISFELEDLPGARGLIASTKKILSDFPIAMSYGHRVEDFSNVDNDELKAFVVFFNLPYAVPVYTRKNVDGIGVCLGAYYPKKSKEFGILAANFKFYFVLSHYTNNIIKVDGSRVNNVKSIRDSYFESFLARIVRHNKKLKTNKK